MKEALILVDIQNDFCPGGALAVNEGDLIVPLVNKLIAVFPLVIATQDWHPAEHLSFAANNPGKNIGDFIDLAGEKQILWPAHCVQNTLGAEFVSSLAKEKITKVFRKGSNRMIDSYSGFYDNNHSSSTGLGEYLRENGVEIIYVTGLATDYCVKFTVLDALKLGFKTVLIADAVRGVELNSGDIEDALKMMISAGAEIVKSESILKARKEQKINV